MSESEDRKKMLEQANNEILLDKFVQQLGSKARVDRTDVEGDEIDRLREVVAKIGTELIEVGAVPRGMEYLGSMTVHVYKSEIMKTAAFLSLNNMRELHPGMADGALRELNGKVKEFYGKSRQKLRSGF